MHVYNVYMCIYTQQLTCIMRKVMQRMAPFQKVVMLLVAMYVVFLVQLLCHYLQRKFNHLANTFVFPQHNIRYAEYKEILIIIYLYKYNFGLTVVGG